MEIQEARKILEVNENSSEKEIKDQFRKLAAKYHPDVNKDPDALEKSKKISEAYSYIKDYKEPSMKQNVSVNGYNVYSNLDQETLEQLFKKSGFAQSHFSDFINVKKQIRKSILNASLMVTIKELIKGAKKELTVKRTIKCKECNGEICNTCKTGITWEEKKYIVTIPEKTRSSLIKLTGAGNWDVKLKDFGDIHVQLNILDKNYELENETGTIISSIEISLLEALTGCFKEFDCLHEVKTITIPAKTKNLDKIIIKNMGFIPNRDLIIVVKVSYPDNVSDIINLLTKGEKDVSDALSE